MNPLKRLMARRPTVSEAPPPPEWVASETQRYFMEGFLEREFTAGPVHARLLSRLRDLHAGSVRDGFHWDAKYPHTKDLRPSAGDYDEAVVDVLAESGIPRWLGEVTGLSLVLAHVQIRIVYPGDSYMDWHRDTHYYGGKLTGAVPPMHKVIFYPALGAPTPQLLVAPGSHLRVMPDSRRDLEQVAETGTRTVSSADHRLLLFDTSLLHAVIPEVNAAGSLRVIYAFGRDSQLEPFAHSRTLQDRYRAIAGVSAG